MSGDIIRRRHMWLTAQISAGTRLAMSLNHQRMATIWAPGSWRPARLLDLLDKHFTLSAILQAEDKETVGAVAQIMLANPAGFAQTAVQMVLITPHALPLSSTALAAAETDAFVAIDLLREIEIREAENVD
jgi:hypothetical protein